MEITTLEKVEKHKDFKKQIVTADLEATIDPNTGKNLIYMAAWYNESRHSIFNISNYGYDTNIMLEQFWIDLIHNNTRKICYFHNWGGYDSILSMASLFNLPGYEFEPMINNGEVMCLIIKQRRGEELVTLLTIKDSIRILPGALAKLAKDWKVETQKEHFPHYFWKGDLRSTILYQGSIPTYKFFEPKRTSQKDYEEMVLEFKEKIWSYLAVSEQYIMGDTKSLFQILIAFFETLVSKFPIDPLSVLSAPSTAFKIWRTVQLPILNKELLKVYDFSHTSLDTKLRESYLGGIVDVYRPHLIGEGYYYDVNSLYPTAMSKPMPVGKPNLINLTVEGFLEDDYTFFGFVEATIRAPCPITPAGYIGLLPIKLKGRLICPVGTFSGFFFSEELRFALKNGYELLSIKLAYSFQRGANTFKDLITQLNEMKIQAQKDGKPTIRNIAKLLMNSMYGRFGMKTINQAFAIVDKVGYKKLVANYNILDEKYLGNLILISYTSKTVNSTTINAKPQILTQLLDNLPGNTNVAIASAVTAYSRMIINGFKLEFYLFWASIFKVFILPPCEVGLVSS
uniref:Probable DNA polymerase n=1 Tax=Rhizophagus fasciculatus TaxID=47032 RepID=A0A0U1YXU9_9GLOM|nr:plasmid related DNA polymerase [Rhizophagus fasciculatus]AJK91311.1 plasmid related DNA polymerase [Rhizophagus fasciculatus]